LKSASFFNRKLPPESKKLIAISASKMPSTKMITYVKEHTIGLKKGERRNHLNHIMGLVKAKSLTYDDLFLALDSNKAWMGRSKQTVKSLLSGTLYALRKNGAIKDCVPPKEQLLDDLKTAEAETEAARAERLSARIAARKAANKERYKKTQAAAYLAQLKADQTEAEIQDLKNKLAISNANAQAAIERADKADAQIAELESALASTEDELKATVNDWQTHSEQLEISIEQMKMDASSYTIFYLFNLICALIGAYFLGVAFPGAYAAVTESVAINYKMAITNAPILYRQAIDTVPILYQQAIDTAPILYQQAIDSVRPTLDYATASARPVMDYASASAKPYINFLLDI
jgi:hypothetical protein